MHLKKRVFLLAVAFVLIFAFSGSALATGIMPLWDNTSSFDPRISFSGTTANCAVTIHGEPGATKIDVTITLQKENASGSFSADTSWEPAPVNGESFNWSSTRSNCTSGVDYRLKVVADVTRNGTTETITLYSDPVTCP